MVLSCPSSHAVDPGGYGTCPFRCIHASSVIKMHLSFLVLCRGGPANLMPEWFRSQHILLILYLLRFPYFPLHAALSVAH